MTYLKTFQTNKYHAKRTTYDGSMFDSKREASKAWELDQLLKAKEIKGWSKQHKIELYGLNGGKICTYKIDFAVETNDGTLELIEIKSKATATPYWRLKWKLLEDNYKEKIQNGEVKIIVEY